MNQISLLPVIDMKIDNETVEPATAKTISRVTVRQSLSQPTGAEIVFSEPSGSLLDRFSSRRELPLSIQCEGKGLFSGHITASEFIVQPSSEELLRVRAYDKLYRMRKKQRIRTHSNITCASLIKEITAEYGISVNASYEGPLWPLLIQHQQSDLDFMISVSQRAGLYFLLKGNSLELFSLEGKGEPVILSKRENLLEFSLEHNNSRRYESVETLGWNPFELNEHRARAENSGTFKTEGNTFQIPGYTCFDSSHAEHLSRAVLDRSKGASFIFRGVAEGNTLLEPGKKIVLGHIHDNFKGHYTLTEVEHVIDSNCGYISRISTASPEPQSPGQIPRALLGKVISVEDPGNLGRVKVAFTAFDDCQTEWLSVLVPAAGKNKGLLALPDVGDRVLILIINNDPTFGIVLGGLYGSDIDSPDWGIHDGKVKSFRLCTGQGQTVILDDNLNRVRLENSDGSYCELNPERVTIHSSRDLNIEAPGKQVVIRGDRIDFERA